MQKLLFTLGLVIMSLWNTAQEYTLSGTVKNEQGDPISGASVRVLEHRKGARSDENGLFSIRLSEANYRIRVTHVGSISQTFDVHLDTDMVKNIVLKSSDDESIEEVTVVGQVGVKKVKESAYNVTVLDAKPTYNRSEERRVGERRGDK